MKPNEFERVGQIPPKCAVCGHYIMQGCDGTFYCQNCGQVYTDN